MAPEELHDRTRFTPLWELDHTAVVRALQPYIWKWSPVGAAYVAANVVALALVAAVWMRSGVSFADGFPLLCLGLCGGYLLLVPVHESVHALAYRALGSTSVRIRYQWRNLTAYCTADRFVVDQDELTKVCLAPFLVLNPLLAAAAWLAPGWWGLILASALLLHVGGCSGDFGMVNWLRLSGYSEIYSYDDVVGGRTYFFRPAL